MANSTTANSHEHHIVPTATYFGTLLALIFFMALTVGISYVRIPDVGPFTGTVLNQVVALIIALIKAYMVVTIFMGVKWVTPLTRMWAMLGFIWFPLLYIIMGDYVTRRYEPLNSWQPNPQSGMSRAVQSGAPNPMPDSDAANLHPRE